MDETSFDIELPKSCLETYYYKDSNATKCIKVHNYNPNNADFCKKLFDKMEHTVLITSESTKEAKLINTLTELNFVKEEKKKINSMINDRPDAAIEGYMRLLGEVERIFKLINDYRISDNNVAELENERKLILSNTAFGYTKIGAWREAIKLDEDIVKIDPKFHKSYARLVKSHTSIENFREAKLFADELTTRFPNEVKNYHNIIEDFEKKFQAHEERVIYLFIHKDFEKSCTSK